MFYREYVFLSLFYIYYVKARSREILILVNEIFSPENCKFSVWFGYIYLKDEWQCLIILRKFSVCVKWSVLRHNDVKYFALTKLDIEQEMGKNKYSKYVIKTSFSDLWANRKY